MVRHIIYVFSPSSIPNHTDLEARNGDGEKLQRTMASTPSSYERFNQVTHQSRNDEPIIPTPLQFRPQVSDRQTGACDEHHKGHSHGQAGDDSRTLCLEVVLVWRRTTRIHFDAQMRVCLGETGGHEHEPGNPIIILRVGRLPEKCGVTHVGEYPGSTAWNYRLNTCGRTKTPNLRPRQRDRRVRRGQSKLNCSPEKHGNEGHDRWEL